MENSQRDLNSNNLSQEKIEGAQQISIEEEIQTRTTYYLYQAFTIWDVIFSILFGIFLFNKDHYNPEDKSVCNTFQFWAEIHFYLTVADILVNAFILVSYHYSLKWHNNFKIMSYIYTVPYSVFLFGTFGTMNSSCGKLFYTVLAEIISIVGFIIFSALFKKYMKSKYLNIRNH